MSWWTGRPAMTYAQVRVYRTVQERLWKKLKDKAPPGWKARRSHYWISISCYDLSQWSNMTRDWLDHFETVLKLIEKRE